MIDFFDILSSKTKIQILRTLYYQEYSISLRQIAAISKLPIFSIQNGINDLFKKKIINKRRRGNKLFIKINKESTYYIFLKELFYTEEKLRIEEEAKEYNQKAQDVLAFSNTANYFFKQVKDNIK